ncbi:MAG: sugar phosphate nucleotidyltransferase [Thermodesulfobacteriota bacterium]|nr:sugar phosphate nucleotidyltransferase [Thermodesulfobacteriota bacterium]
MKNNVAAMILAGGQGKRMGILCQERPKPLLPFAGSVRVIDFPLSNCVHSRISNIAVLIDHQRHKVAQYLKRWHFANADCGNLNVLEPRSCCYATTADAVYQNLSFLNIYKPESVLILPSDHIYAMDYTDMISFHQQSCADLTVGVVKVPIEEAHRFGNITMDSDARIMKYIEKPESPQSDIVSMGIFLFNPQSLVEYLDGDAKAGQDSDRGFERGIIPRMTKKCRVFAYEFKDHWSDIGNIQAYYNANLELVEERNSLSIEEWPIISESTKKFLPLQKCHPNIRNSIVCPGSVVKGFVENSIISPGVSVEEAAVVSNSVLMDCTSVGYHSRVEACVLDERVKIGEFCSIGDLFPETEENQPEITVLGKGVKVPSYTTIDSNRTVAPYSSLEETAEDSPGSEYVVSRR